jgi:hypothetical protein
MGEFWFFFGRSLLDYFCDLAWCGFLATWATASSFANSDRIGESAPCVGMETMFE